LVLDGLATATPGTVNAGRPINVTWLTITDVAHAKAELIINFAGVRRRIAPSPPGLRSGIVKTFHGPFGARRHDGKTRATIHSEPMPPRIIQG
jgi:hypothetical protein